MVDERYPSVTGAVVHPPGKELCQIHRDARTPAGIRVLEILMICRLEEQL